MVKTLVPPPVPAAEPEFLLAVQRGLRAPRHRLGILVHLSRLREARAALPPPHQLHLARTILQDAATRYEGQVFSLRNGDMALLCRDGGPAAEIPQAIAVEPAALPAILARLFHTDMARLVSVWPLPAEGDALLRYAADRLAEVPRPAAADPRLALIGTRPASMDMRPAAIGTRLAPVGPRPAPVALAPPHPSARVQATDPIALIDGMRALLAGSRVADLMLRQTGVRLRAADVTAAGAVPQPTYRELRFSVPSLEARAATLGRPGAARSDMFLFRHLAGRLDARMLQALLEEAGRGGPLDPAVLASSLDLHLHLTIPAILSEAFLRLLDAMGGGRALGVIVSYGDACAAPTAFARARDAIGESGATMVLADVNEAALRLTRPWMLRPDLLRLDWLSAIDGADEAAADALADALGQVGSGAVVLARADEAAALAWGLSHGIELFQGSQVDALLGSLRHGACRDSAACTRVACVARAAALHRTGRLGCTNPALLDGAPERDDAAHTGGPGTTLATAS